jgi:hypothetical protein
MLDVNVVKAEKCGGDRDQSLLRSKRGHSIAIDGILNAYFR